eukprot:CAMPEP_0194295952 /NCGR_PEP_ID=MMETSP0169-20130528/54783_1 /TAXON_ID=218684 /ORGANISM="Corethron pennatum, Strain L29A3" /LENGTH=434 /DNA_ID=CAMNT_0039045261 /DNA_START=193 /DNA_END=1497 /DNA_ORIENTATION=+
MRKAGSSTVMLVSKDKLRLSYGISSGASYKIIKKKSKSLNHKEGYGKYQCNGDPWPFGDELQVGFCSGTLIAEQFVVTAGHCTTEKSHCGNTYFVFNATAAQISTGSFPASRVFLCDRIRIRVNEDDDISDIIASLKTGAGFGTDLDYAVIKLKFAVPADVAVPVMVKTDARVNVSDRVFVVGHPAGLPRKYSEAEVGFVGSMEERGSYKWAAPFSTFGGNSGSGVFLRSTGKMVGIHVTGGKDFSDDNDRCHSIKYCPARSTSGHPLSNQTFADEFADKILSVYRICPDGSMPTCDDGDGNCKSGEGEYSCDGKIYCSRVPGFKVAKNGVIVCPTKEVMSKNMKNIVGNSCVGEWQTGTTILTNWTLQPQYVTAYHAPTMLTLIISMEAILIMVGISALIFKSYTKSSSNTLSELEMYSSIKEEKDQEWTEII